MVRELASTLVAMSDAAAARFKRMLSAVCSERRLEGLFLDAMNLLISTWEALTCALHGRIVHAAGNNVPAQQSPQPQTPPGCATAP